MKNIRYSTLFFLGLLLCACDGFDEHNGISKFPTKQGDSFIEPLPVDNFKLLDHKGKAHELFYYDDADAIVIMIHGNGCPTVRNTLPDYLALAKSLSYKNIRFFLLNSNLQDDRESIAKEALDWNISLPILVDDDQLIGESLALSRTAEVIVINPADQTIIYRGPLNDRVSHQGDKAQAKNHYVRRVLLAHLAGEAIPPAIEATEGSLIRFPHRDIDGKMISYVNDVVPILTRSCTTCHRDGGIAPWSMSSYEMVKGFAPMIREVIRVKRMPPWHADPQVGHWLEDRSLSVEDRRTLVHWVEAGALRGELDDPLPEVPPAPNTWEYGEPDLVINVPDFSVPASGVVSYQFPRVSNPLTKDVWVTAVAVRPGDTKALHHMYVGFSNQQRASESVTDNYLGSWSPGSNLGEMAEGTAVLLPHDADLTFEMHYTPYGRASIDSTQIALYFSDKPPKKILRYSEVLNHRLSIPAGERDYLDRAYHEFERDALLYKLIPHSHYRGKSSQFFLQYPNGNTELLLSVPYYDFNWQIAYSLLEPLSIPAGSKLIHQTTFDNSVHNNSNPDPTRTVTWGLQSEDEMLFGPFIFSWDDESPEHITHNYKRLIYSRRMGFLDRNMDGYLEFEEIPQGERREFYPLFHRGDKDADKKLTHQELMSAIEE